MNKRFTVEESNLISIFMEEGIDLDVGGRKNALDHLDSAYSNGYNPFQTGVHTIIADGLKGTDEALVPVEGGTYVKEAKIGRNAPCPCGSGKKYKNCCGRFAN